LLASGGELYRTPEQQALHIKNGRSKTMNSRTLADRDDLEAITRRINGGLNDLDDRRRLLSRAKTLLGVC
jgi:predicted chitinase